MTLILGDAQIRDPNALRQALADAGVPAKVTPDSVCYNPVPDRAALLQAVAFHQPGPGAESSRCEATSCCPTCLTRHVVSIYCAT